MKRSTEMAALWWALSACGGTPAGGQAPPPPDESLDRVHIYEVVPEQLPGAARDSGFVEVSASASVDVAVDRAHVSFAVETRAEGAAGAASANAEAMDAVLAAIREGGFPGLELETFGYSLRPEYRVADDRVRQIDGYTALNNVRATISDVDLVGAVIDAAIGAGANRISGIAFTATDVASARTDALAAAIADARAQADAMARALGHELGAALEVRGGAQQPGPRPVAYDMMLSRQEAVATPIEAGDQTVYANVTVRFALGPELAGR